MTTENVQLYRDPGQPVAARVDDLLARMTLDQKLAQAGCVWSTQLIEDETVSEQKARELLAFFDQQKRFVVEPGTVEVMAGASSEDIRATGAFEIQGDVRALSTAEIVPTSAEVN